MNNPKSHTLAALAAAALLAGPAHAGIVGKSSDTSQVKVGKSAVDAVDPNDPAKQRHIKGQRPGIAVKGIDINKPVDFQTLQGYAPADSHGVSSLSYNAQYMPETHAKMGVFHFAKVSGADVYFGEWSQTDSVTDATHTVYYAGDDSATTVPASGSATYSVKGISDYANKGLLSGAFTASFRGTGGILTGDMSNDVAGSAKYTVDIGLADIKGATFSGNSAMASQYGKVIYSGNVEGRFFGADAAALAGKVSFQGNRKYDTAFGGTKK